MLKHLILILSIFLSLNLNAQQIYKWVDAKGTVTYSRKKPPQGTKEQKIETILSLGTTTASQKQTYKSNASIPNTYVNPYQNNTTSGYSQARQTLRSVESEALRQKTIKEASTPYKGSKNGQLTANQLRTLATMNGGVDSGGYRPESNSYSAPMPQRQPSSITNCDGTGCWGSDGTHYNRGAGDTYFPSTGGVCQAVGGQMQCN